MRFALAVGLSLLLAPAAACDRSGDPSPRAAGTSAPTRTPAEPKPSATPAPAPAAGPAWTRAAVMRRLDGRRITVEGRVIRIDRATLVCGGIGPSHRRRGRPVWMRFRCVQPTFPPGAVAGPDAILVVAPAGRRRLVVLESRLTGY